MLAATIFDSATLANGIVVPTTRLLVVVRDPRTNVTHPNVVSIPTQRLPAALAESLLQNAQIVGSEISSGVAMTYLVAPEYSNLQRMVHHPVIYSIVALLTRKLGVTEYLEWRGRGLPRLTFTAAVWSTALGHAIYPNVPLGKQSEYISMINVAVSILSGQELFPAHTSSYACVRWTEVARFMEATRASDPMALDLKLDYKQHSINGLCVQSTFNSLAHLIDRGSIAAE